MIADYRIKIDWTFVFLILCPIFYVFGEDLRSVQASFFQVSIIILVGLMHVNKYLGLFLVWCGFQAVFMTQSDPFTVTNLFFGLIAYQFIVKCSNVSEFKKYFYVFLGILALNILWCVRQKFNIDPIFSIADYDKQQKFSDVSGFFGLPAFLGNYASPLMPLALITGYWGVPFVLAALFFSKSSFSVISCFGGVLFFLWFRKRLFFWIALLVLGAASLAYVVKYDLPTGEFPRRLKVWKLIEREAFKEPFFGHGAGSFKKNVFVEAMPSHEIYKAENFEMLKRFLVVEAVKKEKKPLATYINTTLNPGNQNEVRKEMQKEGMDYSIWDHAHNEYLQIFYDSGILGILILLFYFKDLYKRFLDYGRKNTAALALMSAVVAILLVSAGHFPSELARLAGPYLCLFAFLELALIHAKKQKEAVWA